MKLFLLLLLTCCCSTSALAQHHETNPLDNYLSHAIIKQTVAGVGHGVLDPQDLDFVRVPGRENELWILNRGGNGGGSWVIVYDVNKPTQKIEYRFDSHAAHFLPFASAIAMSANGNFGTTQEILNTFGHPSATFMGPTLWTSDTSILARANQNDWVEGELLGSHSDMLHESPYSMGIAADKDNVYWVFDGYHERLYRYDFAVPHPYGHDDHSDGIVLEYDIDLKRVANLPSHMVLDEVSGWLYVVDNGNNRILRVNTKSGEDGDDLMQFANEPLEYYYEVTDVEAYTVDSGISRMSGIDLFAGRLIVSVNNTGELRMYSTIGPEPEYLGSFSTGVAGIMGVKVGPDTSIYYVNKNTDEVVRLTADLTADVAQEGSVSTQVFPMPASSVLNVRSSSSMSELRIVNALGVTLRTVAAAGLSTALDVADLPNGVYYLQMVTSDGVTNERFVVSR